MGLYDTFFYTCPHCGKEADSQTKLGECAMHTLTIGCEFPMNGRILLKSNCHNCDGEVCVIVEENIIINFVQGNRAKLKEEYWGGLNKLEDKE